MSHIPGIDATTRSQADSVQGVISWNHFNHDLLQLADQAVNPTASSDTANFILHVRDRGRYDQRCSRLPPDEWYAANTYCFSYSLPIGMSKKEVTEFVRRNLLQFLLGQGIRVEKKNGKVVITETDWPGVGKEESVKNE